MAEAVRRRNLALLAGGKYFKYYAKKGKVVKALENLLREAPADSQKAAFRALLSEAASAALEVLSYALKRARRDRVVYREFGVLYERDLLGALDVARSLAVWGQRLYASLTYLPSTLNAPEYMLLRRIAKRSVKTAVEIAESLGDQRLVEKAERVRRLAAYLPRGRTWLTCRDAPEITWLRHACTSYRVLRGLKRGVRVAGRARRGPDVVFLDWRLYEIYLYFLIYEVLKSLGYAEVECGGEDLCFEKGDSKVYVLFNKPSDASILQSYDGVSAESLRGRPDVMMRGSRVIVVEAKFSGEPHYVTLGRFKVMAYMYEYDAEAGILIFPWLEGEGVDQEERATAELYRYMARNNWTAEIKLKNSRTLYLVRLDPAEDKDHRKADQIAKRRLRELLRRHGL